MVNRPCSQNAGAASQVRFWEEKEVQVVPCSNPADQADDKVEIAQDARRTLFLIPECTQTAFPLKNDTMRSVRRLQQERWMLHLT